MKIEKNNAKCFPPDSDEEVTITFTGKELGFIYDSLVLLLKSDISRLHSHTSSNEFGIRYYDSSALISCIYEVHNLLSELDEIMELKF